MSSQGGDSISNGSLIEKQPWVAIVAPLLIVVGLGLLAVLYAGTRSAERKRHALFLQDQRRRILAGDIEAHALANHQRRLGPPPGGRANRWAWANLVRREEGLNELGEAPPPYQGRAADAARKEGAVELREFAEGEAAQGGGGTASSPRVGADGEDDLTQPPPSAFLPPAYAPQAPAPAPARQEQTVSGGDGASVTSPAPAVVAPSRAQNST